MMMKKNKKKMIEKCKVAQKGQEEKRMKMLNQVMLVGKIVKLPILKTTSKGIKYANVVIEIEKLNESNEYPNKSDRVVISLWNDVAETAVNNCEIGNLIGVKGRIQTYRVENQGVIYYNYEIVAESFSILNE